MALQCFVCSWDVSPLMHSLLSNIANSKTTPFSCFHLCLFWASATIYIWTVFKRLATTNHRSYSIRCCHCHIHSTLNRSFDGVTTEKTKKILNVRKHHNTTQHKKDWFSKSNSEKLIYFILNTSSNKSPPGFNKSIWSVFARNQEPMCKEVHHRVFCLQTRNETEQWIDQIDHIEIDCVNLTVNIVVENAFSFRTEPNQIRSEQTWGKTETKNGCSTC